MYGFVGKKQGYPAAKYVINVMIIMLAVTI
jgi:hypothetical protein